MRASHLFIIGTHTVFAALLMCAFINQDTVGRTDALAAAGGYLVLSAIAFVVTGSASMRPGGASRWVSMGSTVSLVLTASLTLMCITMVALLPLPYGSDGAAVAGAAINSILFALIIKKVFA